MKLFSFVLVGVLVSTNCFALPENYYTEQQLAEVVIASGCAADDVKIREEYLKSPAGQKPDKILYCGSSCGNSGCSYFIFIRNQEVFDLYRFAGIFSGIYEVLSSAHHDYFDLRVKQRLGAQEKRQHILRYKAHEYH